MGIGQRSRDGRGRRHEQRGLSMNNDAGALAGGEGGAGYGRRREGSHRGRIGVADWLRAMILWV